MSNQKSTEQDASTAKKSSAYMVRKIKKAEEAVKAAAETTVAEKATENTKASVVGPDHQRVSVTNLVTVITVFHDSNLQMQQQLQILTTTCADAIMHIVGEGKSVRKNEWLYSGALLFSSIWFAQ